MWGIGRDHGEEGFPLSLALGHPVAGSVHEDIGAVAVGLFKAAAIPEGWVVVLVAWGITAASRESLSNAAAAVDQHVVEPASFWQVSVFITEVPLAEDPGGVAGLPEYIGQGDCIEPKAFPLKNGVGDSIAKLVPAR
jgi:hypothetical protein